MRFTSVKGVALKFRIRVVIAVLALPLFTVAPAAADPPVGPTGDMSFYLPPPKLPAGNGAVVKTAPAQLPITLPGPNGPLPATMQHVMYTSTDAHDRQIAVTGAILKSTTAWAGNGPRPLMVYAATTHGQGDQCPPSNIFQYLVQYNGGQDVMVEPQFADMYAMLAVGVEVFLVDLQGLGTPGVHTYLNRVSAAHSVLDGARAAQHLSDAELTEQSPIGITGYAQGGGSAAAAAELAASYAPELRIAGVSAVSPVIGEPDALRSLDGSIVAGALGYYINGAIADDPQLAVTVERTFTPLGKKVLAATSQQCLLETDLEFGWQDSRAWTTEHQPVIDVLMADPAWAAHIDNDIVGRLRPAMPVRIFTNAADALVPMHTTRRIAGSWCAQGATVTYQEPTLVSDPNGFGLGHFVAYYASLPDVALWFRDRFAGLPDKGNCQDVSGHP